MEWKFSRPQKTDEKHVKKGLMKRIVGTENVNVPRDKEESQ